MLRSTRKVEKQTEKIKSYGNREREVLLNLCCAKEVVDENGLGEECQRMLNERKIDCCMQTSSAIYFIHQTAFLTDWQAWNFVLCRLQTVNNAHTNKFFCCCCWFYHPRFTLFIFRVPLPQRFFQLLLSLVPQTSRLINFFSTQKFVLRFHNFDFDSKQSNVHWHPQTRKLLKIRVVFIFTFSFPTKHMSLLDDSNVLNNLFSRPRKNKKKLLAQSKDLLISYQISTEMAISGFLIVSKISSTATSISLFLAIKFPPFNVVIQTTFERTHWTMTNFTTTHFLSLLVAKHLLKDDVKWRRVFLAKKIVVWFHYETHHRFEVFN